MDSARFDRLARRVGGQRFSRRNAVLGSMGAALATGVLSAGAQEASPIPGSASDKPEFLFVQLFDSGQWTPKPGADGEYQLTLSGSSAQTLFFSDRPDRIVGSLPTTDFLDALGFTPFNPPNAALVAQIGDNERTSVILELYNPIYTEAGGTDGAMHVTFDARPLDSYAGTGLQAWAQDDLNAPLSESFTNVSLFVDDCPDLTRCTRMFSYVGDLPGGPIGQCWNWDRLRCWPCDDTPVGQYMLICNETYSECQGGCNAS